MRFHGIRRLLGMNETKEEVLAEYDEQIKEYQQQILESTVDNKVIEEAAKERVLEEEKDYVSIQFNINTKGNVWTQVLYPNEKDISAETLGTLFHWVNTGKLFKHCEDTLNHMLAEEPQSRPFLNKIADTWKRLRFREEQVVKPSEVFQYGKQKVTRPRHIGGGPGGPDKLGGK